MIYALLLGILLVSCGASETPTDSNDPTAGQDSDNQPPPSDNDNTPPNTDDTPNDSNDEPDNDGNTDENPNTPVNDPDNDDTTNEEGDDPGEHPIEEDYCGKITPYTQIVGQSWNKTAEIKIEIGEQVRFGPKALGPTKSAIWSWSGCGTTGNSREHTVAPTESCTATVTLQQNECEQQTVFTMDFNVQVVNATLTCNTQAAQCGNVQNEFGDIVSCGVCAFGETCFNNNCEALSQNKTAKECALQGATCGTILSTKGESLYCGDPKEGHFCADNLSEPSCNLQQIDNGKLDDLFAYLPIQITDSDLSDNEFETSVTKQAIETRHPFPFVSRTDFNGKKIELKLAEKRQSPPFTLSFKFIPDSPGQSSRIFQSGAFDIHQSDNGIATTLKSSGTTTIIENNESELKPHSCNHFTVVMDPAGIKTWLNGNKSAIATDISDLGDLENALTIGPWPGRIWDIRVFDQALGEAEITNLGEDCSDTRVMASPYPEAPNYLCGPYTCSWWRDGVTDTSEENFLYENEKRNMTWEHNTISTLLYTPGKFCEMYETGREQKHLTDDFRKNINKENFSKTISNYGLHETFHSYQSRFIENRTGKWFIEASAEWGAYTMKPGDNSHTLMGYYTLQPHQPLWARELGFEEWTAFSEYSGGHMYGAGIFIWYITEHYLNERFVGNVVREKGKSERTTHPAGTMYELLFRAGLDMRDIFAEFAAKTTTWDYNYGEAWRETEAASRRRMENKRSGEDTPWPEEDVDNKITAEYSEEGTQGQYVSVPDRYLPGSWAYNAYLVNVETSGNYRMGLRTSTDNASFAEFRATVVVHDENSDERLYYPIDVKAPGEQSNIEVPTKAGDKLYLVVATTPSEDFQSYTMYKYDYLIERL